MCNWRVRTGRLTGISAEDYEDFYLRAREARTVATYSGAFRVVSDQAKRINTSVFMWGEGEVAGLVVRLAKEKKGENLMKKCSAVIALLFEAAGVAGPTKGEALKMIKKTAVKTMNMEKTIRERRGTSLRDVEIMIKEIYMKGKCNVIRKRFLALQCLLFFGLRRFSDVNRIKVKDVDFKEDGSVVVWMQKTKTDVLGRGKVCKITEECCVGVSVAKILFWYVSSLGLSSASFFFCQLDRKGKPNGKEFLRYGEARLDLLQEQKRLGLSGLSLHSGRIGGATVAAGAGVGRAEIKEAGGWASNAVDVYIRPLGGGVEVSKALVKSLRL